MVHEELKKRLVSKKKISAYTEPTLEGVIRKTHYPDQLLNFLGRKEQRQFKFVSRAAYRAADDKLGDSVLIDKFKRLIDTTIPREFLRIDPLNVLQYYSSLDIEISSCKTFRDILVVYSRRGYEHYIEGSSYFSDLLLLIFVYFGIMDGAIVLDAVPKDQIEPLIRTRTLIPNTTNGYEYHVPLADVFLTLCGYTLILPRFQPNKIHLHGLPVKSGFISLLKKYIKILIPLSIMRFEPLPPLNPIHTPVRFQDINVRRLTELYSIRKQARDLEYFF